ncbi:MAG: hypothetical protein CL678_01275 [Bdellovibrionaceae bacterium]|nr:hypothetical protein [Pseudobdellovibrionaceae bacterium]|tara:strand:- start:1858 stop:2535 length:678 start_codon:yes stop_codon:yes gene_type:complete
MEDVYPKPLAFSAYIDVGAFLPLITAVVCRQYGDLKLGLALQTLAISALAVGVVWEISALAWPGFALSLAAWFYISSRFINTETRPLNDRALSFATFAVALSPLGYVTARPLYGSHKYGWIAARLMLILHLISIVGIVAAIFAKPMITAWGCYPPNTPLRDLSQGMCYKGSLACVIDDTNLNCKPYRTELSTFGGVYTLAINCQLLALHIWVASFVWRLSHQSRG